LFHFFDFFAVLNSGFVNDCYKKILFSVQFEFAKVHTFSELAKLFCAFG